MDPNKTNSTNDSSLYEHLVNFQVTDKCISTRVLSSSNNTTNIVRCETNTSVSSWYYGNSSDCTGAGGDERYGGIIETGSMQGNHWFSVDCSYDDDEDDSTYDGSDCDIVYREWESCDYDASSTRYTDQAYLAGACYVGTSDVLYGSYLVGSYLVGCYENGHGGIDILQYAHWRTQCNNSALNYTLASSGCNNDGNYVQVLECNSLNMTMKKTTTGEPTTTAEAMITAEMKSSTTPESYSDSDTDGAMTNGYVTIIFGIIGVFVSVWHGVTHFYIEENTSNDLILFLISIIL